MVSRFMDMICGKNLLKIYFFTFFRIFCMFRIFQDLKEFPETLPNLLVALLISEWYNSVIWKGTLSPRVAHAKLQSEEGHLRNVKDFETKLPHKNIQ